MLQQLNADLNAALAPGQERTIRPILKIDWAKNDTFTGVATTINADDLLQLLVEDDVDSALPDEVIGRPTASSTTLTAKIMGTLSDGTPLWKVFSPWYRDSPYKGQDLTGAAVQLSVWTATANGATETRRFTGWVKSIDADRRTGQITVVAQNHLHLLGKSITLPRWARITGSTPQLAHTQEWSIPDEDRMENAPLSFAWLWNYVVRQAGAMPGPSYRPNCIWFSSGYGGLIPEKASHSDYQAGRTFMSQGILRYWYPQNWGSPNLNRDVLSWSELGFPSPFANCHQASGTNSDIFDIYSQAGATVQVKPGPGRPRYLNGGLWVRVPSGDSGAFAKHDTYLDSWQYVLGEYRPVTEPNMASVRLSVNAGNTTLTIRSTGAGAASRTFTVATPTTKDTLIYVSYEVDFQSPGNSKIWYNNVQQSTTNTGSLTSYPTVIGDYGYGADKSKVRVWCRATGFANAESWLQDTISTGNRVATWSNSSYGRKDFAIINGGYAGAQFPFSDFRTFENIDDTYGLMPCVTHIPLRREVDAWELLKEMCSAAYATMFIDAYGGLRIIPQGVLRKMEAERLTEERDTITGDSLRGISLHSDYDAVRDVIRYGGSPAKAVIGIAYQATDAKQFQSPGWTSVSGGGAGTRVWTYFRVNTGPEVISIEPGDITQFDGDDKPEDYGIEGFHATNKTGYYPTPPAVLDVQVLVFDLGSQDYFDLAVDNGDPNEMFLAMGNTTNAEVSTPALRIEGLKKLLSTPITYTQGTGTRLLDLPVTDWHSAPWTFNKTVAAMLARTSQLTPRADDVDVPGDPRRELYDLVDLKDPDGGVDVAIAQITGRSDEYSATSGYTQRLSIRLIFPPDAWLMEIQGFSEMEETTYVG